MEALALWLVLIAVGYFCGRRIEAKHYQSIIEREKAWLHLPAISTKFPLDDPRPILRTDLAMGSMVVSIDYYKRMLALLRNFFGGSVSSYESLLDRARREAILRLKESCPGAGQIINLRLETTSIYKGAKNDIGSVEVFAHGTAIYFQALN